MRYSVPVKFIAVLLTAVALVAVFGGILGIAQVADLGLYNTNGFDHWVDNRLQWRARDLAEKLTERYAVWELTNCEPEMLEELHYFYSITESTHWTNLSEEEYDYVLADEEGTVLESKADFRDTVNVYKYETVISVPFPVELRDVDEVEEAYGTDYLRKETKYPEMYEGKPVTIRYYKSPAYTVQIQLDSDAMIDRTGTSLQLVKLIYEMRYGLMVLLAISLAICAAGIVYICCAAGKKKAGQEPVPGGLNRMPLDVYAVLCGVIGYWLAQLAVSRIRHWVYNVDNLNPGTLTLAGLILLGVSLLVVGFLYALVAQIKTKDYYWWNHSFLKWGLQKLGRSFRAMADVLPVIWSYLLIGILLAGILTTGVAIFLHRYQLWPLIVAVAICAVVIGYGGYCYGLILRGAEKMAKGDLNARIHTRFMIGAYSRCARNLNALADVAIAAAQKQLQSERMKTELITNISHDIKTPLTSIINYVDILQAAPDGENRDQYLDVLGRQSQRLKKLIEDLMEMSRASSGSIRAELTEVDTMETMRQALGEFSDKLEGKGLTVVFADQAEAANIIADGRLTWRVLSNLLSNVVKYAMPGTRVYAEVTELENQVQISLKNISKEPLNMTAEELMERFVRGDTSRNTEGSGLGLNIAKSLMELQKGQLKLLADGDLFKATLIFPKAK